MDLVVWFRFYWRMLTCLVWVLWFSVGCLDGNEAMFQCFGIVLVHFRLTKPGVLSFPYLTYRPVFLLGLE